ncbi:MAG: hypothetical protein LBI59_03085 [Candidatus Accumulibacter sp.]|jgi:hypothetical protein|nr:hypothetical protein [Accumulibacter sp.]
MFMEIRAARSLKKGRIVPPFGVLRNLAHPDDFPGALAWMPPLSPENNQI